VYATTLPRELYHGRGFEVNFYPQRRAVEEDKNGAGGQELGLFEIVVVAGLD
jgi:hypothetical protein